MNRNRLIVGLASAMVLALILSMFVYREFKQASAPKSNVKMGQIVVAASPLPLGTRLDASKLRTIPWPTNTPVPGMFTKVDSCVNRALITSVAENEPILENRLAPQQAGAGLPATIPQGMRAISVAVNDVVAVAGFVTPGTMVDVLVTGTIASGSITRTILENVRVLAAGQKIEQDREGKPQTVTVITLLVTPEDAGKLAMASTSGKIQLALRNTVDSQVTAPPAVFQTALYGGTAPPPVAQKHIEARKVSAPVPPASDYVVEVITGSKRENKSFPNPDQPTGATSGRTTQTP